MFTHIKQQIQHFTTWLWQPDIEALPATKIALIRVLRISSQVADELHNGLLNLRAMSLVYTTLLSLVPLLAVSFSVLKGFGVHNQLEPLLLNLLSPLGSQGEEISSRIIEFVDNTQAMALGSLGLGMLIFTVISLMQKIEQAFNHTWHITQQRSFTQRFSNYLSVVVIGPVLVFSALGVTATMLSATLMQQLISEPSVGWLIESLEQLLPYFLISAAFTMIYLFIPNTRVQFKSALLGGLIAALLWQTSGWLFASFVANSASHAAVYSAFAALILFIIWLYLGWLILLIGSSIAYHHQHPVNHYKQLDIATITIQDREQLGILIIQLISQRFYQQQSPYSSELLCRKLALPIPLVNELLSALKEANIIAECNGEKAKIILPARPFDEVMLSEAVQAIRSYGQSLLINNKQLNPQVLAVFNRNEQFNITLKQLAEESKI